MLNYVYLRNVILWKLIMNEIVEEHFAGKVAQKAVITKGSSILLIRDPREGSEIWELPGGRLNIGEIPQDGLRREIKEELGVDVEVHEVVHLQQFLQGSEGKNALMIAYRVTLINPDSEFILDEREIAEARFVPLEEALNYKLFPEYKKTIEVYLKMKLY